MRLRALLLRLVTQDPLFLETIFFSGFLPELKGFLISNSAFLVPLFYCGLNFYAYYNRKPKPPSGPDSGSEGVVLDTVWTRTAEDYSGDSASSGSDLVSLNYLREEANLIILTRVRVPVTLSRTLIYGRISFVPFWMSFQKRSAAP